MYKSCNKHLTAAFEGILNKNTLRLNSKLEVNRICFPSICRIDLTKQ